MKKNVKYVLNTKLPDSREAYESIWTHRMEYTLQNLLDLCDVYDAGRNTKSGGQYSNNAGGTREYYTKKLESYNVNESNWRDMRSDGNRMPYIAALLRSVYPVSKEYAALNDKFLAEYNSREDLQEFYKLHAKDVNWLYDRFGNHYARGGYYKDQEAADKDFWEAFNEAPSDYTLYQYVAATSDARIFLERNRETPFGAGELVKLRAAYIEHPDYDPLWISRYEQARLGVTIPDKSTERIGMVMKVTDNVSWRATKGSKQIEVLWQGSTSSVMVPEKVIKFETRPTYANGLKKRE